MSHLTKQQHDVLVHTLGLYASSKPAKNFYCTHPGRADHAAIRELLSAGILEICPGSPLPSGEFYVRATRAGVRLAVGLAVPDEAIDQWLRCGLWPRVRNGRIVETWRMKHRGATR